MIPISMAYPGPVLQKTVDGNVRPPESDIVKYGEYISTMGDCMNCHTAFVKGNRISAVLMQAVIYLTWKM